MNENQLQYNCARAAKTGDLFANASVVRLNRNSDGGVPIFGTSARLCYDDEYLYVEMVALDDGFTATMTQYNDRLYTEDVVEIFIDEDCDGKSYIELEVNPLNALLHYVIRNDLHGTFWAYARIEKNVQTEVELSRRDSCCEWKVLMKIPLTEFKNSTPKAGDIWAFNLYRIKYFENRPPEYSSFSPTHTDNYHIPQYFAALQFV